MAQNKVFNKLHAIFEAGDKDCNGYLSKEEIKDLYEKEGHDWKKVEKTMAKLDISQDGKVSIEGN